MREHGETFRLDPQAVRMTPRPGDPPTFSYRQTANGAELITVSYTDERVGAIENVYDLGVAEYVGRNLIAMVTTDLDELRRGWDASHA